MRACPDFKLALPVYDANDALRIVRALEAAISQIWETHGAEMAQLLEQRGSDTTGAQSAESMPSDEQSNFPF
ncbi:MAG: hypothetical protein HC841_00580 [Verrucomicrobiae bacterium]|nr:hypothetical protein [Verrucomicrobiae bacterium]NJO56696.1 hypothetical protein [Rhodospirillales bacterium]